MSVQKKGFDYKQIPYSKVVALKFTQNLCTVEYKTEYKSEFSVVSIISKKRVSQRSVVKFTQFYPEPNNALKVSEINNEKRNAVQTVMKLMPEQDKTYHKVILKLST